LQFYSRRNLCRVIKFCNKHGLSPSVKAGGYGTGGWAINGDIVIDLSNIQDIDIEPPQEGDGYTSLRDTAMSISKGKGRVGEPVPDLSGPASRKHLFEGLAKQAAPSADALPLAWLYSTASTAVASFLHGHEMPPDSFGEEPRRLPLNRGSLGVDGSVLTVSTVPPVGETLTSHLDSSSLSSATRFGSGSGTSLLSSASGNGSSTLPTNPATSGLPHSDSAVSAGPVGAPFAWTETFETAPTCPDPFAYMDNAEPPMSGVSLPSPLASSTTSWGSDAALLAHPLFSGNMPSHLTRPVPPHTHAYVSFGAGSKQKDVDQFTASHPLGDGVVPYHVPLCVHLLRCTLVSYPV
jgi:hypothetical protein